MRWPVIVFVAAALSCAIAHIAIVASVIRRRTSVVDGNVPRPRAAVEIAWALVPVIALAFLLTATWERVRERGAPHPAEVLKVAR
jgi:heme/copper-type cytochrome/quinol oxidase subunit 2